MRTPTYLTAEGETAIMALRGVKRPVEVSREYKIGLARLYKLWAKNPQSDITQRDSADYKQAQERYRERRRLLADELTAARKEIAVSEIALQHCREEITALKIAVKKFPRIKKITEKVAGAEMRNITLRKKIVLNVNGATPR